MSDERGVLKPCPFCGGEASVRAVASDADEWVECGSCHAVQGSVERWNRRVETAEVMRARSSTNARRER